MNYKDLLISYDKNIKINAATADKTIDIFKISPVYDLFSLRSCSGSDTLYLICSQTLHLEAYDSLDTRIPILWLGDNMPEEFHSFVNHAHTNCTCSMSEAASVLQNILLESYQTQTMYLSLLQSLFHGGDLSAVLSEIAEQANTTIIIIDLSGKILAHSTPLRFRGNIWQESVPRGYCSPEFMEHVREIWRNNRSHSETNSENLWRCETEELYYLFNHIILDGSLFGYVYMIQETPDFDPQYKKILPLISQIMGETVLKNQEYLDLHSRMQQSLLTDLLNGISNEQALSRIQTSGLNFSERSVVLVVHPLYYHGKTYLKSSLFPILSKMFRKSLGVIHEHDVVMILSQTDASRFSSEYREKFESICKEEHLTAGISNPFTNPAHLKDYYLQAKKACALSQKIDLSGAVHSFCDIAIYDLLDQIPKNYKLAKYCHPALATLREHDQKNGTQLYNTLKTYALAGFNQNLASEQLFLHRNTMNYRRQKIEEVTSLNLDNPKTRFILQYSFIIDYYLEHLLK